MKRFLAIAITVVLLIGAIVVLNACSGGREIIDGAVWELSEDGKSYTLINLEEGYAETSYAIPETIDGKPVTAIADSAFAYYFPDLVSITIPESVTSIGKNVFRDCKSLTFVNIPDKVTVIESQTFLGCTSLKSVDLPDGITMIGDNAFGECESLESIIIPDSVTSIGMWVWNDCSLLKTVSVSQNVVSIGEYAFPYDNLEKIYFGGTKSAWLAATGEDETTEWDCDIHCSDGIIEKDE